MLLKNELVCSSPTKGSKHGLKGVCKEGLCFKASYELLKWEKPKLSMSAFDFQYIFTLNWGVSHPSLPKALPNSTNSNFPVPQGHPHCTDFHRLFPEVWFTFLKVTEVPSKKKRTVWKTTGKFTFFAARSLLLGNNQLSSWADFKLYFLKKDQLSALTHWVLQLYKIMFKEKCLCYRNDPSHLKGASPPAPSSTRKKKY